MNSTTLPKLFIALLTFTSTVGCSSDSEPGGIAITIEVINETLPEDSTIYLTGNSPIAGRFWDPKGQPLVKSGENKYTTTLNLKEDFVFEYKFTLGTWDSEAITSAGRGYDNFRAKIEGDTVITHTIPAWKGMGKSQVTGQVDMHRDIKGIGLLQRNVLVWLPPGYEDSEERYPVLYMHDGQQTMDPSTSTWGKDWRIDESLDSLIRIGEIPPLIVVNIYNTADRSDEYGTGEKGDRYISFISKTLKPMIDENYRTKPGRQHTLTGGASMGGLISFRMIWEAPEVFSKAICMSSAFQYEDFDYIAMMDSLNQPEVPLSIYLDNGTDGIDETLAEGFHAMKAELDQRGISYISVFEQGAPHTEEAWGKRFPAAIKAVFRD
ncbi:MAG: histidine kinase [Flavobacteriales bacterium]|nr:histidine kinase [Flavobacteriales bacterium]